MYRHVTLILSLFLMLTLLMVSGCTTSEVLREVMDPKNILSEKTKLDLTITMAADLNPDQNGRPSPVVVRIYSLKSPSIFENTDYVSLYYNDKQVLSADFSGMEEHDFRPSQVFKAQLEFDEQASFVGFLVAFQDIEQSRWRMVLPLERKQHNDIHLKLTRNSIVLVQDD